MSLRDPEGPPRSGVDVEEGHLPVMVEEVMEALWPLPGSFHIDATLGGGGHALRILEAAKPDGRLLGLDADAVNVKAKTGEGVGSIGRKEAISCQVIVLLDSVSAG